MKRLLILSMLGVSCSFAFAETAKTIKAADLLKEPSATATKVLSVPSGAQLTVSEKKGFWVKATSGNQTGWLKLSEIELQVTKAKIDPMATGRSGSGNIVNTAGARGLSPDELKSAKPNPGAVDSAVKVSSSVTDADLSSFASAGGIASRSNVPPTSLSKNAKSSSTSSVTVSSSSVKSGSGRKNDEW